MFTTGLFFDVWNVLNRGVGRESLVSQPKISQHQEEEPPPEAPPEEEEPCSTRKAWVYGINNHVERLDAEVVQAGD